METSILASAGRMLWRYLDANRVDADDLFNRCGLDPSLIHESRTRYPFRLLCKAFVEAEAITCDENLGLALAKFYNPLDLNALGVTFLSSETLVKAFRRLLRYESVVNSNLMLSVTESEGRIQLDSAVPDVPRDALHIVEDARSAVLVDLCRLGLDSSLDPVEIAFTHPEPKSAGDHFGVFRCTVKFHQPASRISFDMADAERPFTAANRELAVSGDRILEGMINELRESDIINQVKRAIIETLPSGTPSDEAIARQLLVSSRTLQRRLADKGTNFRTLVLEVRRELAEKYIADRTMPLAEISYMLGFSDTSSFSRAFKQWTGDSPAIFRSNISA
jgi:AraC-like DNA-binding protein